MYRNVTFLI